MPPPLPLHNKAFVPTAPDESRREMELYVLQYQECVERAVGRFLRPPVCGDQWATLVHRLLRLWCVSAQWGSIACQLLVREHIAASRVLIGREYFRALPIFGKNEEEPFRCKLCGDASRGFIYVLTLRDHVARDHAALGTTCTYCGKWTIVDNPASMRRHQADSKKCRRRQLQLAEKLAAAEAAEDVEAMAARWDRLHRGDFDG